MEKLKRTKASVFRRTKNKKNTQTERYIRFFFVSVRSPPFGWGVFLSLWSMVGDGDDDHNVLCAASKVLNFSKVLLCVAGDELHGAAVGNSEKS